MDVDSLLVDLSSLSIGGWANVKVNPFVGIPKRELE